MHPLLKRQLKKLGLSDEHAPSTPEAWSALLKRISTTYTEADQSRALLERSLELSSREMRELYEALRQNVEGQLAVERDKLQILVHSIGVGVCATDAAGRIQSLNPAAERLLGRSLSEVRGQRFYELVHILDATQPATPLSGADLLAGIATGLPFQHDDAWFQVDQGASLDVSFVLNPLLVDGSLSGAVLVFQDISARKQAEAQRAQRDRMIQRHQAELLMLTKSTPVQDGSIDQALRAITESSASTLDVARASIWRFTADRTILRCQDLYELSSRTHSQGFELPAADFPAYFKAIESERVIAAAEAQEDPRTMEFTDSYLKPLDVRSMLDVPIQWRGQMIGVLCHEHVGAAREWQPEEIAFAQSVAHIITEALEAEARALAQQALRVSEEHTRLIIDTALDAVVGMDESGRIIDWNRQATTIFGWTREEAVGQDLATLIIPLAMQEAHRQGLRHFLKTGEGPALNKRLEVTALRRDGREFPIELAISLLRIGSKCHFSAFVEDISERKRLQEEMFRTTRFLDSLIDSMPIAVFVKDTKEGRIVKWNRATEELTGLSKQTVMGRLDEECFPAPIAARFRAQDREVLASKVLMDIPEETIETPARGLRILHTKKFPILDRSGDPQYLLGIAEDITEQKQAEAELKRAKNEAEDASKAKSEFLANMSHEIRTPMNGVIGMTELLKSTELTRTQRHYLDTIASCGEALLLLINDILDFSKIEAGKLELQHIDFDLRTTVESVMKQLADRAQQKGIELLCYFHATVPTAVQGDPGRIRQVLTNLVGNAVKFTAKGEVVTRVTLEGEAGDGRTTVRISVSDSGLGISHEGLGRLFQSFTQVDGSTTRQYGGTGLGLAISKQLTELMGGRIGVESELGKGSTFWIVLPLTRQKQPQPHPADPTVLKGARVCVVDNLSTSREILQHYLQSWGLLPLLAQSGEEAMAVLEFSVRRGEPCQAVILDFQLPDMDGMRLARLIRSRPEFGAPPIVLMTALGQRGDADAALQAGCSAYLTKPVGYLDLYECLLQILSSSAIAEVDRVPHSSQLVTRHSLAEARNQRRFHVLVVEDNAVNQEVAAMLLRNLGCRVDLAGSGHEALDAFRQTSYDLIFMDCQMPGMDGCEATRAIRKMEQADGTGPIPIVALTANALLGDREACLAVGMNDHLSKPFTKERLHAVVEQWLTHRGSQTGSASDQPLFPPFPDSASAGPTAPTPGIVDRGTWKIFEELDEPGQPDSLSHFMEIFLRDTTRKMSDLRVAVSTEDVATVAKIAHSLKSVSAVLGAMRLAALYKDMEANGLSSNLEPVQALLIQVEDEFQAVCDIFRNELTKRGVDTR